MPSERQPYYFYRRKRTAGEPRWYVRFRRTDGTIGSPVCTQRSDRQEAERWVARELAAGRLHPDRRAGVEIGEEGLRFGRYATDWWVWERCPYMRSKMARGFHFSRQYAAARRSYLTRHVLPKFEPFRLDDITPMLIDRWVLEIRDAGMSPATCNRILGTLKVMLAEAVRLGLISINPASAVGELKEEPRERGILTGEELRLLFVPDAFEKVWKRDLRHLACNMLAAAGGLRLGECQALQIQHVHPGFVHVVHGWDDRYGLQPPKWNSVRIVPIPARVQDTLHTLVALGRWGEPEPDDVLFWGRDRKTPLSKTAFLKALKAALGRIGIPEETRRQRNLVFHSHRHTFNTLLRGKVADEQLRRVTGHKTLQLTEGYDHPTAEHLADVARAQEALFSGPAGTEIQRSEGSA